MKVLFFAKSREAAGCSEGTLDSSRKVTQPEFWALLVDKFPGLASMRKSARLARSETYLEANEEIFPNDEIAVIPPVSGG
jgi:MoaE-MoaD fusion protein